MNENVPKLENFDERVKRLADGVIRTLSAIVDIQKSLPIGKAVDEAMTLVMTAEFRGKKEPAETVTRLYQTVLDEVQKRRNSRPLDDSLILRNSHPGQKNFDDLLE